MSSSESDGIPNIDLAPAVAEQSKEPLAAHPAKNIRIINDSAISDFEFRKQYYTNENFGYCTDPFDPTTIVVLPNAKLERDWKTVYQDHSALPATQERARNDDPVSPNFKGPWAYYKDEEALHSSTNEPISQDQLNTLSVLESKRQKKLQEYRDNPVPKDYEHSGILLKEPTVTQHEEQPKDYQGRSFTFPPSDLKSAEMHTAYIPKRCTATLAGHTEGVQCAKFIPHYGHLLLSCSLDSSIKIWDVVGSRKCIQTYKGHSNSIRDICWDYDGTSFLSASYDRLIRHWDTETGKVLSTFTCRRIPYCLKFNLSPLHRSAFIVGTTNRRIVQYDINSGKKVQNYDEHLGAVNTICFVDDYTKFISASDDKKVYMWEFGIPILAKHINEPNLSPLAHTELHPGQRHFVGQCIDNRIVVFEARGGFRLNRRKNFVGHMSGGYSCSMAFSPDGKYLASGDSNGRLWFWDWKTTKNYRTIAAHDSVCIGVDWHPIFPSTVATCSWDGVIKLWD